MNVKGYCKDCEYCIDYGINVPERNIKKCHRFPPTQTLNSNYTYANFPIIEDINFCGEWKERNELKKNKLCKKCKGILETIKYLSGHEVEICMACGEEFNLREIEN